jgi:hypothetical protein
MIAPSFFTYPAREFRLSPLEVDATHLANPTKHQTKSKKVTIDVTITHDTIKTSHELGGVDN